ncbi:MAG: response regulator [Rubrivivax sp.]|nr:response regulator [Rubrivivax sp.]
MPASLLEIVNAYLMPFALALPLALLLFLLVTRRDDRPPAAKPPPPAAAPAIAAPVPAPPPAQSTVLVADDSAVARAKLRKLLEAAGYRVLLASDGEEALEIVGREALNVIITDLEMPKLDGFAVIAAVQGSLDTEDLPIIAITGHDELQARVHDCQGLYGIFKKPWNDRELLKRVATVAALRRPPASA